MNAAWQTNRKVEKKLAEITPFILTYNEEPNIARCLEGLMWASQILVVDSGSTDRTLELIARFPNAHVVQRKFDSHSQQANFALSQINSQWVLSLDADYILPPEFQRALREGDWCDECAYFAPFRVCVRGKPLRSSLYPPRAVLYAHTQARYEQDGHTQRFALGDRKRVLLPEYILHDDRKSRARWMQNQRAYALSEAEKLVTVPRQELGLADRIRRTGWLAPILIFPYVLLIRGLIWDGWRGIYYAMERSYAEFLLCLLLHDNDLRRKKQAVARSKVAQLS